MKKEFKLGDKVKIINNVDINGNKIETYEPYYIITDIEGNEVELSSIRNNMMYKFNKVKKNNLKKVEE